MIRNADYLAYNKDGKGYGINIFYGIICINDIIWTSVLYLDLITPFQKEKN